MGKKKKSAPQGADPQQQVQYMIDLSRETHARGNLGSAVFQAEEGLKIARQHLGYENITVREDEWFACTRISVRHLACSL